MSSDEVFTSQDRNHQNNDGNSFSNSSLVDYYGPGKSSCGYCKSNDGAIVQGRIRMSYDMRAERLTVADYQALLDRQWRRSGSYCYHPINWKNCCPNFTICLNSTEFSLSKSQRRCIRKLNSFLMNGNSTEADIRYVSDIANSEKQSLTNEHFQALKKSSKARARRFVASCDRKVKLYDMTIDEAIAATIEKNKNRHHHSQDHLATLDELLYPIVSNQTSTKAPKHVLRVRMQHVDSEVNKSLRERELQIIQKYQLDVHKEGPEQWDMSRYSNFLVNSPLITEPMRDYDYVTSGNDLLNDTKSKDVTSESIGYLISKPPDLPTHYGTYHCCYFLDEDLIAVGVLDVLPKCVTTVYFFYDTKYSQLNLGTYSALVEISMIREISKRYKGPTSGTKLAYYYMGFYVHECKKMHYKTKFKPAHLLCSQTFEFVPVETCLKKLDGRKYARFSDSNEDHDYMDVIPSTSEILSVPIAVSVINSSRVIDYILYLQRNYGSDSADLLINSILVPYVRLTGGQLASRMYLDLNHIHDLLDRRFRRQDSSQAASGT